MAKSTRLSVSLPILVEAFSIVVTPVCAPARSTCVPSTVIAPEPDLAIVVSLAWPNSITVDVILVAPVTTPASTLIVPSSKIADPEAGSILIAAPESKVNTPA